MITATFIVGVDIGTSGCKAVVINTKGQVKGKGFAPHKTSLKHGGAEQDPDAWVQAFERAVAEALTKAKIKPKHIAVIGIDGMMNTPVFVDNKGKPLRPALLWMDQRSVTQAAKLRLVMNNKLLNGPVTATSLLAKMAWLRENEPEVWRKFSYVMLPKDYVRYKLTGIICTDPSDASATQLFDVAKNAWSQEISKILDLSMSKLPVIVPSHEIIGKINRGVLKSVPVIAGCADAAADNLAAGVIKGGECLVRLGTCGALFLVQEALPITSEQYYVLSHCVTDLWLTHNLTPAGLALDWFAKLFNLRSYNDIDKLALRAPVGSRGLFFYPYLLGEHTPRVGRPQPGGFVGLSLLHGRSDLARAVLEGIAFSVRECFETLVHTTSQRTGKLIVAGGGARSKIWVRIIADVIGEIVYLPKNFDASFGAALLGGIGAGVFKDVVDAVQKCVTLQSVIPPRRRYSQLYSSVFKDYIFVAELLGRKEMDTRQIL